MLLLRVITFLMRRRLIKLLHTDGAVMLTFTRSRHCSWRGELRAWALPLQRLGDLVLHDDGSVSGRGAAAIVAWKYLDDPSV